MQLTKSCLELTENEYPKKPDGEDLLEVLMTYSNNVLPCKEKFPQARTETRSSTPSSSVRWCSDICATQPCRLFMQPCAAWKSGLRLTAFLVFLTHTYVAPFPLLSCGCSGCCLWSTSSCPVDSLMITGKSPPFWIWWSSLWGSYALSLRPQWQKDLPLKLVQWKLAYV